MQNFSQKCLRTLKPPDELAQNVSKKEKPFRTNYSSIFSKVQNLTVFSIIYMIRIRFFGSGEIIRMVFPLHSIPGIIPPQPCSEQEHTRRHADRDASSCDQERRQMNAPRDPISSILVAEIE